MRRSFAPARSFVLLTVFALLAAGPLAAQDAAKSTTKSAAKPAPAKPAEVKTDAAHDAAAAEMMKYMMPGPSHEKLKSMEGSWKAVAKSWFAPGEPMVSEGASTNKLILGGRYLLQEYRGSMMGQPFEGWGLTGFDNRRSVYTTYWIDNMSTASVSGEGTMDAAGKEMTLKGKGDGPDGKLVDYRMVTRIVDPNTHVYSMYTPVEGKDQMVMEITYTRQ